VGAGRADGHSCPWYGRIPPVDLHQLQPLLDGHRGQRRRRGTGVTGTGGNGGDCALLGVAPVSDYPPQPQPWGNYAFWIYWTQSTPYRPYAGALYAPGGTGVVLQPDFDRSGTPPSGLLGADGSFAMTSTNQGNLWWCPAAPPATVTGTAPQPGSGGVFPNLPASVGWQWSGLLSNCHGEQRVAPVAMPRDAAGK
jgi:hypothetical protein